MERANQPDRQPAPGVVQLRLLCRCGRTVLVVTRSGGASGRCGCGRCWRIVDVGADQRDRTWLPDGAAEREYRLRVDVVATTPAAVELPDQAGE
jgi:hypothetical protein